MTPTLSLDTVTHRYGDTLALDDVSLTLSNPGIHGLLGRNGSGKTTLMSLVAGLRKASRGAITLDGQPVYENFAATSQICIIRESGDTTSEWTETINDGLTLARDMRPYWDDAYANRLLDRFQLSKKHKVNALSRGQRAKFACLLGLAARAPLTMFDESYLGMDAPTRYDFYDALLEDFMAHPRLILVSSHHIEEIAKLFEEVIIIEDGRVMLHESADALRGRGLTLTGPAAAVDAIAAGANVLSEKTLGSTKMVALYDVAPDLEERARAAGLETALLPIQDIFVHLTAKRGKD
ncbi:ATP-binding cassette domain-containing protein [Pelagibacterium luteolum]|uniref:ABC-2 type transport system ATP-binding protein n=1 Tax=Pelagibacterium luteolum TaxID=440168 RepID=A0A1G7WVV2_9HYPH|nr:ABC transporter ATP-binding protein [Pelagibacterium luteolum]SDG76081.1 ABC-2 type transport system ATP-binding protein [Pelagibacterium luteolum]